MNTDTIIQIALAGVQLTTIIAYMAIFRKSNKKNATDAFTKILGLVPNYIKMATATIPNATSLQVTNYVLAMIKSECQEANIKYNEKKVKEQIEKEI